MQHSRKRNAPSSSSSAANPEVLVATLENVMKECFSLKTVHGTHPVLYSTSRLPLAELMFAGLFRDVGADASARRAGSVKLTGKFAPAGQLELDQTQLQTAPNAVEADTHWTVRALEVAEKAKKKLRDPVHTKVYPFVAAQIEFVKQSIFVWLHTRGLPEVVMDYYGIVMRHQVLAVATPTLTWDLIPVCKTASDLPITDVWQIPSRGVAEKQCCFQYGPLGQLLAVYSQRAEKGKQEIWLAVYNIAIQTSVLAIARVPDFATLPCAASIQDTEDHTYRVMVFRPTAGDPIFSVYDDDRNAHYVRTCRDHSGRELHVPLGEPGSTDTGCRCKTFNDEDALSCATAVSFLRSQRHPLKHNPYAFGITGNEVSDILAGHELHTCACVGVRLRDRAKTVLLPNEVGAVGGGHGRAWLRSATAAARLNAVCDHGRSELAGLAKEDTDKLYVPIAELTRMHRAEVAHKIDTAMELEAWQAWADERETSASKKRKVMRAADEEAAIARRPENRAAEVERRTACALAAEAGLSSHLKPVLPAVVLDDVVLDEEYVIVPTEVTTVSYP